MNELKPIIKWLGGKRKEINKFEKYFPNFVKQKEEYTFVEPFVGGGAVFFYLENSTGHNVINDFDAELSNFYKIFASQDPIFLSTILNLAKIHGKEHLEKIYFQYRNKDQNNGLANLSPVENAIRFFIVNQLAFSGIRRFNKKGEYNISFGYYDSFNVDALNSDRHIKLLKATEVRSGDFQKVMEDNDKENAFMFLDPPYTRVFKKYSAGNSFGEPEHERLKNVIDSMKYAKVMMILDKSDFTQKLHQGNIKETYGLRYKLHLEGTFNPSSEHMIITNY